MVKQSVMCRRVKRALGHLHLDLKSIYTPQESSLLQEVVQALDAIRISALVSH